VLRRAALGAFVAVIAACSSAAAAPVFTTLGSVATSSNTESNGGCTLCTAFQISSPGSVAYTFPYDGVITRWNVHTGQAVAAPSEWVRARTFHVVDSSHATVVTQGAQTPITTTGTTLTTWDRIPAVAGDVLGLELSSSNLVDDTRAVFHDGAVTGEITGVDFASIGVGQTATATGVDARRVNISARFEHDADHDGYGDGSQDLCTGDPAHGGDACSGSLFGSDLQAQYGVGGPCNFACPRVQTTTAGGASTAAPFDGVVVRWRLQAPQPGMYLIRVLSPAPGGGYTVTGSSDPVLIGSDEQLWTFTTRLPIASGGYIAMLPPPTASEQWQYTPPAGATWSSFDDAPSGNVMLATPVAGVSMYDADIEPDADHDGYGDITQDACPTDASTHGTCTSPVDTTPPPPQQQTPPGSVARITGMRLRYARFRVAHHGKAVAARTHIGSAVVVRMSAAAKVRFTVLACRSKKSCTRSRRVHAFTRFLPAGMTSIAYSGRYRDGRRVRSLVPGRYRLAAAVLPANGATTRTFTVVR
jgi:hypothetical protein